MLNFYLSDNMDGVQTFDTEEQIPHIQVKNMPAQVDGWNCGTHVLFWILETNLNVLKYFFSS